MKQIVNTVNTVDFNEITNNSFVGIDWGHDHKAMVIRVEKDKFMSLSNHSYCNLLDCWDATSMQAYITNAIRQGDHVKAYAFYDLKELLTWLTTE
jgi:hypothetical protein